MTTAGAGAEYTLTQVNVPVNCLTAGPDGALWFCDTGLGRMTTAGQISHIALTTAGNAPYDITTGPDGKLWFTESSSSGATGSNGVNSKIGQVS